MPIKNERAETITTKYNWALVPAASAGQQFNVHKTQADMHLFAGKYKNNPLFFFFIFRLQQLGNFGCFPCFLRTLAL